VKVTVTVRVIRVVAVIVQGLVRLRVRSGGQRFEMVVVAGGLVGGLPGGDVQGANVVDSWSYEADSKPDLQ